MKKLSAGPKPKKPKMAKPIPIKKLTKKRQS
jgi:hypothetical protein